MNNITYWDYSDETIRETAIDMRARQAVYFEREQYRTKEGFNKLVYDFHYDCLIFAEKIIGREYSGTVLEIGAGTGKISCLVSKYKNVKKILALEYSEICVKDLMTFIIKKFKLTESEEKKIYPVVGSFNDIKLPDKSVDFVLAMSALHHSEDREKTLKEIYRVLKIGGYLVAADKANPNYFTNKMLNDQLDLEWGSEYKKKMGYDVSKKYTRRMNSEHTPLMAEWEYLIPKCGFKNNIFWFLSFSNALKQGKLPFLWNFFGRIFYKIFGNMMIKRNLTQLMFAKIPHYPWFSKSKGHGSNILIVAKKEPYIEMP